MKNIKTDKKEHRGVRLQDSVIIHYLTVFSTWLYANVIGSVFGFIMTSYKRLANAFSTSYLVTKCRQFFGHREEGPLKKLKHSVAKLYEKSWFLNLLRKFGRGILLMHINNFALIFFSYGFCVVIIQLLKLYTFNVEMVNPYQSLLMGAVTMAVGIFMFFSKKSVAAILYESKAAHFLLFDFLGISIYEIAKAAKEEPRRNYNISLVFGMLLGALSIVVEPISILLFFAGLLLLSVVITSPEAGIILTFFFLPFMTTMQLVAFMCLVYIAYFLKLVCGRRVFRVRMVDVPALIFMGFTVFSGIFSIDGSSFKKMLVFVCFMLAYFVIRNTLRTPALVKRSLASLVASSVVVSLIGLYQNYFGTLTDNWLDTDAFADIKGRVVSTFGNPNVLGEYLILIFPVIMALMISTKKRNERFSLLVAACINCACLVFTWSRGAWLGFIVSFVVFLLVSGKHGFTGGILSIPLVATALVFLSDTSVMHRLTNIGDSSSSYRFNIWKGSVRMLGDVGLSGIGIGEGAFAKVYPQYALSGIEAAPHSHSLYLQIPIEMGIFALLSFLVFLFFYTQNAMTFIRNAEIKANKTVCLGLFAGVTAFLVQGFTDYVWYNYRIFLLFWMIMGLALVQIDTSYGMEEENERYY